MYRPLAPCPGCARHVLASEAACPFCRTVLPNGFGAHLAKVPSTRRMARSAVVALGASLALSACSSTTAGSDASADVASQPEAASDGAPDVGSDRPTTQDASADIARDLVDDDGGPVTEYGGPPIDAGFHDAADDEGGAVNLYGAPVRDAGADEDAALIAAYGIPPRDGG